MFDLFCPVSKAKNTLPLQRDKTPSKRSYQEYENKQDLIVKL